VPSPTDLVPSAPGSSAPSPAQPEASETVAPVPAGAPSCPSTANSSITVKKGETFVSENEVSVRSGEGVALFVDTDAKFPYRVAGTSITGSFPPGQQVLCFALPKAGTYALLSGERVVVEFTVN